MALLVGMYILLGILMAAVALPMIRGKVKPNGWYGFRTPLTITNPDIWYPANAFAGRILFWVGVVFTAASALLALVPGISVDAYALLCTGLLLVGLVIMTALSFSYLNRLKKSK